MPHKLIPREFICKFTAVLDALFSISVCTKKPSKSPILLQQLVIGAHLRDFSVSHYQNCIHLRQIVDCMGYQNPCLQQKKKKNNTLHYKNPVFYKSPLKISAGSFYFSDVWNKSLNMQLDNLGITWTQRKPNRSLEASISLQHTLLFRIPFGPITFSKICFPTWASTADKGSSNK